MGQGWIVGTLLANAALVAASPERPSASVPAVPAPVVPAPAVPAPTVPTSAVATSAVPGQPVHVTAPRTDGDTATELIIGLCLVGTSWVLAQQAARRRHIRVSLS